MPDDYSAFRVEISLHLKKADAYLESSQSMGPIPRAVALANAESKLLESIASHRQALAAIRDMQTPRAWQD